MHAGEDPRADTESRIRENGENYEIYQYRLWKYGRVRPHWIALANPDSAPIKRLIQDSKDDGRAIDVTCGRRTRAVIITDSEHVILSAIQTETIANRLENSDADEGEDEDIPADGSEGGV